jgi:hypothetical protein
MGVTKNENKGNEKMKNGILGMMIAAGTVMMGVHTADAAEFIFRYRGMGPTQVAAVEPEEPESFDVSRLSFGASAGWAYGDNGDGRISIGDYFWNKVTILNPVNAGGTVQVSMYGTPYGIEPSFPSKISCVIAAGGTTTCEQTVEIKQSNIDFFCATLPTKAGHPVQYSPVAVTAFGNTPLTTGYATVTLPTCTEG